MASPQGLGGTCETRLCRRAPKNAAAGTLVYPLGVVSFKMGPPNALLRVHGRAGEKVGSFWDFNFFWGVKS